MRRYMAYSLGLISLYSSLVVAQSKTDSNRAVVTFADGSTQVVENMVFVYEWLYKSSANMGGVPLYKKTSNDFYYSPVVRGVQLEKAIPRRDLDRIEIGWQKSLDGNDVSAANMVITLKNGQSVTFKGHDSVGAPSSFLQNKPIEQVNDPSVFGDLRVEGFAIVEGQRGQFALLRPAEFREAISPRQCNWTYRVRR